MTEQMPQPDENGILPYWKWQKAANFKRFTSSWQRSIFTVGVTYYEQWDFRYDRSLTFGKPDLVLKRIEFGLYWWEFSVWWVRPWPEVRP